MFIVDETRLIENILIQSFFFLFRRKQHSKKGKENKAYVEDIQITDT